MNKPKLALLGLFVVALGVLVVLQQRGVFSLRDLAGGGSTATAEDSATAAATGTDPGAPPDWSRPGEGRDATLAFADIQRLLANAPSEQRQSVLSDPEKFRQFIQQEARNRSLLAAARANDLHEDPDVRLLMQRAADNVLREIYMQRLLNNKLPEDFPQEAQVRQYYEQNREQFRLGERLHIWQIFLPFSGDGEDAQEAVVDRAEALVGDIRAGEISFAEAALNYSAHPSSRNNGGYMGLVKAAELRPGLAEAIRDLEQGRVSDPVRTDQGVHILRKGETVAGRAVSLDEVREQVRNLLRNQGSNRLQQAVYDKAAETYPVDLSENRIEEWRLRLRTGMPGKREEAAAED